MNLVAKAIIKHDEERLICIFFITIIIEEMTTDSPTDGTTESRTGELKTFFKPFELVSYQYQYYWLK